MQSTTQRSSRIGSGMPLPVVIAIGCIVVAIITTIWAMVNHNRLGTLGNEAQELRQDNAILRENANATAYIMEATDITPTNMRGVAYIGTSGSGVVVISNVPPTGDNEVFQLWLLNADNEPAIAAGTLFTSDTGQGFALIPADSSGYTRIAISLESASGNTNPSGGFLLVAVVNSARGDQAFPMVVSLLCQNHIERLRVRTWTHHVALPQRD